MGDNIPSLAELRSYRYVKRAKHSDSGITHGRYWEQSTIIHENECEGVCSEACVRNRQHTLRISASFAQALRSKPGPKGRRSSRVPGSRRPTNPKFNRVSEQVGCPINSVAICVCCLPCPMTEYSVCLKRTLITSRRKEKLPLVSSCQTYVMQ